MIFATLILVLVAFLFLCFALEDQHGVLALWMISLILILLGNVFLSVWSYDWRYNQHIVTVKKVYDVDCVFLDGEFLNLNETFKRSFEDGQQITILKRELGWYGTFYWECCDGRPILKEEHKSATN